MDLSKLTPKQREIVFRYQRIHTELSSIEESIKKLTERSQVLIKELEQLRDLDKSL
jgi:hypothetical protein